MAKFKVSTTVEYDDRLQTTAKWVLVRIENKINKILQEYSKQNFNGSFEISPAVIKEMKKKE